MTNRNKERIQAFDFIRGICTVGIIAYHYSLELDANGLRPFISFANGNWGKPLVMIFFILSGASLFYNNKLIATKEQLYDFYKKRWKSIFPMFYIAFGCCYLLKVITYKKLFYKAMPWTLLLSVIGQDGYLKYAIDNYYQVGEWFLGGILLVYLIYPVILNIFQKSKVITTMILGVAQLWVIYDQSIFQIDDSRNLITCLFAFELGMLFLYYRDYFKSKYIVILTSLLLSCIIVVLPLKQWNQFVCERVLGITLFITLFSVGTYIMRCQFIKKIFIEISRYSYSIFLVHHVLIYMMMKVYKPVGSWSIIAYLVLCILGSLLVAKILFKITELIINNCAMYF